MCSIAAQYHLYYMYSYLYLYSIIQIEFILQNLFVENRQGSTEIRLFFTSLNLIIFWSGITEVSRREYFTSYFKHSLLCFCFWKKYPYRLHTNVFSLQNMKILK